MPSMQSAFHLLELPLGGQQTSLGLLCVCSSHPRRAVSLTHNPADSVYHVAPSLSLQQAENNNDSHILSP